MHSISKLRHFQTLSRSWMVSNDAIFSLSSVQNNHIQTRFKSFSRKPMKKFKPSSRSESHDDEYFESEADQLVSEADRSAATAKKAYKRAKRLGQNQESSQYDDIIELKDDENSKPNHLPPGMSISDLPSFERIMGWDKSNYKLKSLKQEFIDCRNKNEDVVILEGKRLILDAMNSGLYPKTFVFSRLNLLEGFPFDKSKPLKMFEIPYKNISVWTDLSTSPGIMATFDLNEIKDNIENNQENQDSIPITVILDNVRTPDNVGALIRVAAAVGCKQILAMKGCADVWSPKALRAGAGAHFKVPIQSSLCWSTINSHIPNYAPVILADSSAGIEADPEISVVEKIRQLDMKCRDFRLEGNDMSFCDEEILEEYSNLPMDTVPLQSLNFGSKSELVVVFGGETHGLSDQAKKLAHSQQGCKFFVPLRNNVDSLNVASAASVVLFHLQAQLV